MVLFNPISPLISLDIDNSNLQLETESISCAFCRNRVFQQFSICKGCLKTYTNAIHSITNDVEAERNKLIDSAKKKHDDILAETYQTHHELVFKIAQSKWDIHQLEKRKQILEIFLQNDIFNADFPLSIRPIKTGIYFPKFFLNLVKTMHNPYAGFGLEAIRINLIADRSKTTCSYRRDAKKFGFFFLCETPALLRVTFKSNEIENLVNSSGNTKQRNIIRYFSVKYCWSCFITGIFDVFNEELNYFFGRLYDNYDAFKICSKCMKYFVHEGTLKCPRCGNTDFGSTDQSC